MTNREVQQALQALQPLLNVKLPVKTAMKLRNMVRALSHITQDIEAERMKIVQELVRRNEDGQPALIDTGDGITVFDFGDNRKSFDTAYAELMNCQSVGQPAAIKLHELGDIEIDAMTLLSLGELVEEHEAL